MKRPVSLDRREAYARARAAAEPQRGRSYEELFLDNLIGLDNDYTSTVESMADVYNQDKVGFLKNAGIAALQGAKQAVLHPIDTATGMVSDIYESGANVAKTLGPDPTYLNDALQELYGVGIEDATDDQISGAREALLGDIFAVGSMIPVGKVAGTGVMAAEEAIDAAQRAQMRELQRSVVPKYFPETASGSRPYTPSRAEVDQMLQNPTATQELYLQSKQQAEDLLAQGVDPEVVLRMTGVMPVPLRTSTGADYGYRLVSALPEEDFTAYRPQGIAEVVPTFRKKLPKGVSGSFSQTDEQRAASLKSRLEGRNEPDSYTLAINQKQSLPKKQATWTHEVGHYDYREGDLGYSEIGSDPKFDRENKRRALETLNNLISTTNDPDELARLHAARDELSSLTGKELYSRNPGEMAARLAEGDPTMLKRLTVLQTLNPYINTNVSFPKRVGQAARTALFSETRPPLLGPAFAFPYDRHVRVPMDMGKALISDPNYTPINTFNVFDPNLDLNGVTLLPDDLPSGNRGAFPSMLSASDSFGGSAKAVIRPDDIFRGEGRPTLSFTPEQAGDKYAIRTTQQDQIDDMIASGLVRPKPGGYGKRGKSTLYFGLQDTPQAVAGTMPGQIAPGGYAIVGKAGRMLEASGEHGISLDALEHVWKRGEDGQLIDILPDIREKNLSFGTKKFADGGVVPGKKEDEIMADRQDSPYNILNLEPEAFVGALDEMGLQGEERQRLEQAYFEKNRPLPMTERPEGRRVGIILPMSWPEGMTGAEALMSGEWDWTAPELLRGLYEAPAEAANVTSATLTGTPVTQQQMAQAATDIAGTITLPNVARTPRPNTLTMSGVPDQPPRMGDNGGPPLEDELFDENGFLRLDDIPVEPPKRFINPSTGMYSPSYEAARTLKQEVGTPQQMRAMLLNNGAKEEELAYSGFDEWLRTKGDQKVTKQEIEDILGLIAAGRDDDFTGMAGSMPFMSTSFKATGVTGAARDALADARENVYQDMVTRASRARENRIRTQLADQGYVPLQLRTEEQFRQLEQNVVDYTQTPARPRSGTPARVFNAIYDVNEMMRAGEAFDSPAVQNRLRRLRAMNGENNFVVGPDGNPRYLDDAMYEVLPDEYNKYPSPNGISNDEMDQLFDEMTQMSPQEVADYLGLDPQDFEESFIPEQTSYSSYAPEGLMDYSENLYMFDDTGRGVTQGLEALGATPFQQPHYSGQVPQNAPIMFHTRTGRLLTPSGPAHHIAEMQSDIAQNFRGKTDQLAIPGVDNSFKLDKGQKAALTDYVNLGRKFNEVNARADEVRNQLYNDFADPETGALRRDAPGFSEALAVVRNSIKESEDLRAKLTEIEQKNNESLFWPLRSGFDNLRTLSQTDIGEQFDVGRFEEILSGKIPPKGALSKTVALPFATSTNRWVDAALKNELIKAANSDAEWFTLPKGEDVVRYTYGKEEGQTKFYEGIVPSRLKGLASKFLPEGVEFQELTAQGFGKNAPQYKVFGMRLTPELKQYIRENGFPTFKKGGVVDGSSLDVDIFALD